MAISGTGTPDMAATAFVVRSTPEIIFSGVPMHIQTADLSEQYSSILHETPPLGQRLRRKFARRSILARQSDRCLRHRAKLVVVFRHLNLFSSGGGESRSNGGFGRLINTSLRKLSHPPVRKQWLGDSGFRDVADPATPSHYFLCQPTILLGFPTLDGSGRAALGRRAAPTCSNGSNEEKSNRNFEAERASPASNHRCPFPLCDATRLEIPARPMARIWVVDRVPVSSRG
jgi:hypothetical protein